MRFAALISFIALSTFVVAHPGEEHVELSKREHLEARERHIQARNCAAEFEAHLAARKAKREGQGLYKRASTTSSAAAPHYTTLQNTTCVLAPEVTEGPYYINNEIVRTNLIESQTGVKLVLDIGVLDTTTCKPLSNAFVELWAANATGVYGGYGGSTTGGGGGGGGGGSSALTRNETFLRGGYYTGSGGVVELTTIYPGFYAGRTAHIHTMVHKNWAESANGTLVSHSGSLIHIGQFFFDETWNNKVFATSPYSTNTQSRTLNTQDSILTQENSGGNNAYLSLSLLGSTISDGILAYITLGVDSSKSYTITNTNYLSS